MVFYKGFSTILPLNQLIENIYNSLGNKNYYICITKPFDTFHRHHRILLDKLANSGVSGVTLDGFASYLADREYWDGIGSRSSISRTIYTTIAHRIKNPLRRTSEHIASYIFKILHNSM